jgi:hypothetical protein
LSAAVLVTAACTKFLEGAWVVVLGVPMLMWLAMRIRRHYEKVAEALKLRHPEGTSAPPPDGAGPVAAGESSVRADAEAEVAPSQVRHLTVVPVSRLDLANLRALAYAAALRQPVMALHISPVAAEAELFRKEWMVWGNHLPLVVVMSPFRTLVPPLLSYIHQARAQAPDLTLTVVVPELIVPRPWQRLLHNNLGARLRRSLRAVPGLVICSVPVHLPR